MSNALPIFISGIVFGLLAGYRIPGEGNLLLYLWSVISKPLNYYFTPEHSFSVFLIGAIVFIIAIILLFRPIIEAILEGFEGLVIFMAGGFCGLLFTFFVRIEIFALIILLIIIYVLRK